MCFIDSCDIVKDLLSCGVEFETYENGNLLIKGGGPLPPSPFSVGSPCIVHTISQTENFALANIIFQISTDTDP